MRFGTAVALIAAFVSTYDRGGGVHAAAGDEEPLLRRREQLKDEGSAGYVYEAGRADNDRRAAQEQGDSSYRYGTDYGTDEELGRYEYSKGSKGYSPAAAPVDSYGMKGGSKGGSKGDYYGDDDDGGKGWKGSKCKGSKGPKGHKGGYYGDDDDDDGCDDYAPYPMTMHPSHMMVPPAKPPMMKPSYEPAPVSPPTGCPDPDPPEKCLYDSDGKEYCEDPDLTCQKRCLPALCKVEPHGPPKYHDGHAYDPPTTYVPIGSTCKWWEYATSRGEPEICCELKEYSEYDPPGCGVCYDCQFPQVVNEACCAFYPGPPKHHDSEQNSVTDRSGEYEGCPDGEVCCKCGSHSYKCISSDYQTCDETVCGIRPSPPPTPNPTAPPTPGPTPPPSPGPTPDPTPGPTPPPSPGPTPPPSPAPTPGPTVAPTFGECEIRADIDCDLLNEAGTVIGPCDEIQLPPDLASSDDLGCFVFVEYSYIATNTGEEQLEWTALFIDGGANTILQSISLAAEASDVITPDPIEVNICEGFSTTARVEGNGGNCEAEAEFAFEPPCQIEVEVTECKIDGQNCTDFVDDRGLCERNAQFKYNYTNKSPYPVVLTSLIETLNDTDGNIATIVKIPGIVQNQTLGPNETVPEIQDTIRINLCSQGPAYLFVVDAEGVPEGDSGVCVASEMFPFTIPQLTPPPTDPPTPRPTPNPTPGPTPSPTLICACSGEPVCECDTGIVPPPGNTEPSCISLAATGCDAGKRPGENGCCEAHFCDPSSTCVECLGVAGVGCNSNDVDACCDEALMCGLNSDLSRVEENALPVEQRLSSDQCCVKNGLTGCRVGTNEGCCNYETAVGGYVCESVNNANDPGLGECCVPDRLPAPVTQGERRADLCCSRSYDENGNCGVSA